MSPRAMTRYVFEEIRRGAAKRVKCAGCGKAIVRSRTFSMTLNPFNVDPATGEPRTRSQIVDALVVKAREWQEEPEHCTACLRTAIR